jgi:hypothetical protein
MDSNLTIVKDSARRVQRMESLFDLVHQFPGMCSRRNFCRSLQIAVFSVRNIVNTSPVSADFVPFDVVWTCTTYGGKRTACKILFGKSCRKRLSRAVFCLVYLTVLLTLHGLDTVRKDGCEL